MNIIVVSLLIDLIIYKICNAEESTTYASIIAKATMNVTDSKENNKNENTINVNLTRITQPTTNIEFVTKNENPVRNLSKSLEFVPSPQLESYIEYNRFPVIPAFPEAKQQYSKFSYIPPDKKQAENKQGVAMVMKKEKMQQNYYKEPEMTTLPAAEEKQLFPTSYEKPTRSDFPSYTYYERYNYPAPSIPATNSFYPTLPALEWYNKVMFPVRSSPIPVAEHPYPFIKDVMSTISYPKSMMHELGTMSPWKRAAKLFAAILPIGLLISALTPSILTIGPANTTDSLNCRKLAGRAEELGLDKMTVAKWSKPGCEARLLCETAVRDDKLDVETVKKLFWAFVSQNAEDSETPEELEAVSNAIKEKRCDKISCRRVRKKLTKNNIIKS